MNLQEARDKLELFHGPPISVISDCLRGFMVPAPGHDFIAADFSSIESRVLNWLAGQEDVLDIYRTTGQIYEHNAAAIYRISIDQVTKEQRQIGKIAELALGFQGGRRALQAMASNYGLKIPPEEATDIKLVWRAKHQKVVKLWNDIDRAVYRTVLRGEKEPTVVGSPGREISYRKAGSFLWCRLPSGRVICYPYPRVEDIPTPWGQARPGVTYMAVDSTSHKWERQKFYGGLGVENVVQAVARDLLADAMKRLEAKGYLIVLHVHDEIVCEVPKNFGSVGEMEGLMAEAEEWAKGLPIQAVGWRGGRYRK